MQILIRCKLTFVKAFGNNKELIAVWKGPHDQD